MTQSAAYQVESIVNERKMTVVVRSRFLLGIGQVLEITGTPVKIRIARKLGEERYLAEPVTDLVRARVAILRICGGRLNRVQPRTAEEHQQFINETRSLTITQREKMQQELREQQAREYLPKYATHPNPRCVLCGGPMHNCGLLWRCLNCKHTRGRDYKNDPTGLKLTPTQTNGWPWAGGAPINPALWPQGKKKKCRT